MLLSWDNDALCDFTLFSICDVTADIQLHIGLQGMWLELIR